MNILIIEDEEILSKVLKDKFLENGWGVKVAFDGDEGLDVLKKSSFSVVLLDLLLPKKDGFQVLREIRENPDNKALPVLVISNLGGEDDIKEAMKLGATDYFVKNRHSLKEIVKKAKSYLSV